MAKCIGIVRFVDGEIKYFIFNMMVDAMRPQLFDSYEQAGDAWDDPQEAAYAASHEPGGEVVEVFPTWGLSTECKAARFYTRVDRGANIVIGPMDDLSSRAEFGYDDEVEIDGPMIPQPFKVAKLAALHPPSF